MNVKEAGDDDSEMHMLRTRIAIINDAYANFFGGRDQVYVEDESPEGSRELRNVAFREAVYIIQKSKGVVREKFLRKSPLDRVMGLTQALCIGMEYEEGLANKGYDVDLDRPEVKDVMRLGREACVVAWEVLQTPPVLERHAVYFPVMRTLIESLWTGPSAYLMDVATLRAELLLLSPSERLERGPELREARAKCSEPPSDVKSVSKYLRWDTVLTQIDEVILASREHSVLPMLFPPSAITALEQSLEPDTFWSEYMILTGIGFLAEYVTDEVSSGVFLRMFLASPPRTLSLTVTSTLLIVTHASNTFDLTKVGFAKEWKWTEEHDSLLDGIVWTVSRRGASKQDTLLRAFASVIRCLTQCHLSVYHMSKRCHGLPLVMLTNISMLLLDISQKWARNEAIEDNSGRLPPSCNGNPSSASVLVSVLQSTLMNEPPLRSLAVLRALGLSEETMKKLVCTSMQSPEKYKKQMVNHVFHMVGLDRDDVHFTCRRIPAHSKGGLRMRKKSLKEEQERADRIAQQLLMEEERAKEEEEEKRLLRASKSREKKKRRQKKRKEDSIGSSKESPEEPTTKAEDDEEEATTHTETSVSEALLCCAYTGARMQDPVLLADGRAYERAFAQSWLCNNCTSPVSGKPLRHTKVVEDALLISVL